MTDEKTIQQVAKDWLRYFTTTKRGEDIIYAKTDDAPEFITNMVYATHDNGNTLPDDYRYQFIVDALYALSECDDPDDINIEADVYTSDLTAWLASGVWRVEYMDEAISEFGASTGSDVLSWAQYVERMEVAAIVNVSIEEYMNHANVS